MQDRFRAERERERHHFAAGAITGWIGKLRKRLEKAGRKRRGNQGKEAAKWIQTAWFALSQPCRLLDCLTKDFSTMSLSKELLHISISTRIISDHLNFLHELEEKEIRYGPCELPRPKLRDRQNPFDMRPMDFRRTFGMTREAFSQLLSMIEP